VNFPLKKKCAQKYENVDTQFQLAFLVNKKNVGSEKKFLLRYKDGWKKKSMYNSIN
jgi:hypothetical protein